MPKLGLATNFNTSSTLEYAVDFEKYVFLYNQIYHFTYRCLIFGPHIVCTYIRLWLSIRYMKQPLFAYLLNTSAVEMLGWNS